MALPVIGITMGDPTGVGPEVIVKALAQTKVHRVCKPFVIGDKNIVAKTAQMLKMSTKVEVLDKLEKLDTSRRKIQVISVTHMNPELLRVGRPDKNCGKAMFNYVKEAINLAMSGRIAAIVTAPINKFAMNEAGFNYGGHTEILSELTETKDCAMMLAGSHLKVSLVTTHCPLREVAGQITPGKVLRTILYTHRFLQEYFGIKSPYIAVTALNPHAGEAGLFGIEEKELILPAIRKVESMGIKVKGPAPSDTLFHYASKGEYDAVVCMYHDQALIPLKMVDFTDSVNITLGIPIIRTSVDHGTAYDIAWKGEANPNSMIQAILMAARMAKNRRLVPQTAPSV